MLYALIVAGGSGSRMKSILPKQFLVLGSHSILYHTLHRFYTSFPEIRFIVVLPHEFTVPDHPQLQDIHKFPHVTIVEGGQTRFESVKNGLAQINNDGIVFIHDAVRPFVPDMVLQNCLQMAREKGNAIPVIPVKDSLRVSNDVQNYAVDRTNFVAVQTPQTFQTQIIKKAYQCEYSTSFTDDASVLEASKQEIFHCVGDELNFKITTPLDLELAIYLQQTKKID
ncbi:MAG TPA: 2-C-methyl-D-erythritol 4-phosphate cytidylyltransferase [Chitinophagaceae bacterium]|nr:2-C-methyl-D-erythritol 4-phosphate cytidylyltransferase [Chitinophagaceae bacterium]